MGMGDREEIETRKERVLKSVTLLVRMMKS